MRPVRAKGLQCVPTDPCYARKGGMFRIDHGFRPGYISPSTGRTACSVRCVLRSVQYTGIKGLMTQRDKSIVPHSRRIRLGYSLIEILVVLAIIGLIAAVVGPRLFTQLDRSKTTTARLQIRSLEAALETMRLDIGRLPTTQEGLNLLVSADPAQVSGWYGPYLSEALPSDPWGRPYVYVAPGASTGTASPDQPEGALEGPAGETTARVMSYGADGAPGGQGVNADVTSATP